MKLNIRYAKDFTGNIAPSISGVEELDDSWSGNIDVFGNTTFTRKFLIKNDHIKAKEALLYHFFPRCNYFPKEGSSFDNHDDLVLNFFATPNFVPIGDSRHPIVRAVSATIKPLESARTELPQRDIQNIPINNVTYYVMEITFEHTGSYRSIKRLSGTDPDNTRLSQMLTEHFEITSEFKTIPNNQTFYWDDSQTLAVSDTDIAPTILYSYTTWKYKLRYLPFDLQVDDILNKINNCTLYSHKLNKEFEVGRVLLADVTSERFVNWDGIPALNAEFTYLIMEEGHTWNDFPFKNSTVADNDEEDSEWRHIYDSDGNILYPYTSANLDRYIIDKAIDDIDKEYGENDHQWWD